MYEEQQISSEESNFGSVVLYRSQSSSRIEGLGSKENGIFSTAGSKQVFAIPLFTEMQRS